MQNVHLVIFVDKSVSCIPDWEDFPQIQQPKNQITLIKLVQVKV